MKYRRFINLVALAAFLVAAGSVIYFYSTKTSRAISYHKLQCLALSQSRDRSAWRQAEEHKNALLDLGYLKETRITMHSCVLTGAVREAFCHLASQKMPTNDVWEIAFPTNHVSVLVQCPEAEIPKWQTLIADYDKP